MNENIAKNLDKRAIFNSLLILFVVVKNAYRPHALGQYIMGIGAIFFVMSLARIYSFVKFKHSMVTAFPMNSFLPLPKSFARDRIVSVTVLKKWMSWNVKLLLKDGSMVTLLSSRSQGQAERYASEIQKNWERAK